MAFWPSSALLMVTKPKPRGRLVSRSMMRLVSETVPYLEKRAFRSCSVVWKERFPTYNFILFIFCVFEVATSRRLFEERAFARMKYRWERSGNLRTTTWLQREAMDRLAMTLASFSKESRISSGVNSRVNRAGQPDASPPAHRPAEWWQTTSPNRTWRRAES